MPSRQSAGLWIAVAATGLDRYIDIPSAALFLDIHQLARHTTPFRMILLKEINWKVKK
jgi:uncharacterized membrane protein (DUF2068 family)